jgi:hypothetical protein
MWLELQGRLSVRDCERPVFAEVIIEACQAAPQLTGDPSVRPPGTRCQRRLTRRCHRAERAARIAAGLRALSVPGDAHAGASRLRRPVTRDARGGR